MLQVLYTNEDNHHLTKKQRYIQICLYKNLITHTIINVALDFVLFRYYIKINPISRFMEKSKRVPEYRQLGWLKSSS
jgi:hypothetical protein